MNSFRRSSWQLLVALWVLLLVAQVAGAETEIQFTSLDASFPVHVSGTLYLPDHSPGPLPAVVMIHGSTGIDVRNQFYREPLLNSGIAVFEVDFKTGIFRSPLDRPKVETFTPLAFAALKELRKQPAIDAKRIGIMGFSLGGAIALQTSVEDYRKQWMGNDPGFVVHVAFYPVCKVFLPVLDHVQGITKAPMMVLYGTADSYGDGTAAPRLKQLLKKKFDFDLNTVEYPGASHGFNRNAPPLTYPDPGSNRGVAHLEWDEKAANDSVPKVTDFLRLNLVAK